MGKLKKFCLKKAVVLLGIFMLPQVVFSQYYNCIVFNNDKACFEACEMYTKGLSAHQGSKESQEYFDLAIKLCPKFAPAYMEKAVPFLKQGDLSTWKLLIDKAVKIDPKEYLGYRGWCRFQFARDYEGAIEDISVLQVLSEGKDIGYCQTGDYHLLIAKALCLRETGKYKEAVIEFNSFLNSEKCSPGYFDYLHLGVTYIKTDSPEDALRALKNQININPNLSENYYYLALTYIKLQNLPEAKNALDEAKKLHLKGYYMRDPYTRRLDHITLNAIEKAYAQL
jgi:tetratricopeptide (TPR) repeat protein